MSDLPHIGPVEVTEPPKVPAPASNDDQPFTARPFGPLVGFLELGESELTNQNETILQEIWDYLGKESGSETTVERLHALRQLENKLAPPRIGQSRLAKIHSYVQAQQIVEKAEKWRDGHMRGINSDTT